MTADYNGFITSANITSTRARPPIRKNRIFFSFGSRRPDSFDMTCSSAINFVCIHFTVDVESYHRVI